MGLATRGKQMSQFEKVVVEPNAPRLVIEFRYDANGVEQFNFGVVGQIPLLSLIGAITCVQSELFFRSGNDCPMQALVIAYDPVNHEFEWFKHPDTPLEPIAGMLEVMKNGLVTAHIARMTAQQQTRIRPYSADGQIMEG